MNDRYLFRAKSIDDGELVEGFLIKGRWYLDEREIYAILQLDLCIYPGCEISEWIEIDKSTICQCTGLKDNNGRLIWENDIVELYDRNTDCRWVAIVRFGNPNCEYTLGWQLEPIGKCEANTDILCWIEMEESGAFCEVIGSAIDNPELL